MSNKITTQTKILSWKVAGVEEAITLDVCDFLPGEVAELSRVLRADEDKLVQISLQPKHKEIEPINAVVRLLHIDCRPKGQKLDIDRFKSPNDRAGDMKGLILTDEPILLTISQLQRTLFEGGGKDERIYTVDADGFVVDTIEQPIDVPDFLKVECKLLFAHIEGKWYYGYEIKGRIERSRRVNTLLGDGVSDLTMCLRLLWDSVKESLHGDISRLAEFIYYKIQTAIEAVQDKDADLAEAMAQEIRLPADFLMGKTAEDTEIAEKTTEEDAVSVPPSCPSATSATSAVTHSEVMVFKAMRLKQAFVTITLQNRDDGWWRAGYEWQLGNATDGERVEAGAWYQDKRMCMQDLLAAVVISLAAMQISGTADARRSMESRRNTLREQFEDWLEEKIDEAESETGQDLVPFEEDVK